MADNSLQVVESPSQLARPQSFAPQTFAEALIFAEYLSKSSMIPVEFRGKPENILVAIQHGAELSLPPMQSLNCICVINGKPAIYGPSALAVVKSHRDFEYIKEWFDKASQTAFCEVKRRGEPAVTRSFSKEDAIRTGLWDDRKTIPYKDGSGSRPNPAPWHCYSERMQMFRARGFALNDCLPDALRGIVTAEEARDYPGETIEGTVQQSTPPPASAPELQSEPVIGKEKATSWYRAYRASGWLPADSKTFLMETFKIESPRTSQDIPVSGEAKAFEWANTKAPIRVKVDELFASLGFTQEEQVAFVNTHKIDWPKIAEELAAEIERRNKEERGE